MTRRVLLSIVLLAWFAPVAQAHYLRPMRVGILECEGHRHPGYFVTSSARLRCLFRSQGYRPERYAARLRRFGIDLGVTARTRLAWAVTAPVNEFGRSELRGRYGGFTANGSAGVGFGGNFLWGGPDRAAALQPISLQGQIGLNIAAGVVEVDLQPILPLHRSPSHPSSHLELFYR
ncbi:MULTISPECIES: DUF992 domain-containing protein [unclassified Bradyrhizobium]|uniref:DUF992 domain-containing protein n=1 Tax=unclassified Bradyrhizobium TaxID=2631580 RepID=UPI0028E885CE|nr:MULTISPECIES: DUF992 domain-containing protein [unclassified Bradyrhizobium]